MKQERTLDVIGTTSSDDIRRRYAKERFLAFMAEKFWAEKLENEKIPQRAQPSRDQEM